MRIPIVIGLCALVAGCGSPPSAHVAQGPAPKAFRSTQAEVLKRRQALAMTQAYRAKMGMPMSRSGEIPASLNPVTALLAKTQQPELGYDKPYVQGIDDARPAPKGSKIAALIKADR